MKPLTNADDCEAARQRLDECLTARGEWFCAELGAVRSNTRVSLHQGEWELSARRGGLHFSYWSEAGARVWRVVAWECADDGRVRLDVTRRAGAERATLQLIARATVADARAELLAARQQACAELAARVCRMLPGSRVERARLSAGARRAEPGRYARVLLRRGHELIAATGAVAGLRAHEVDAVLASALVWWLRLQKSARRRDARPSQLWLVVEPELRAAAGERLALLCEEIRGEVRLCETRKDAGNAGLVTVAIDSVGKEVRAKTRRRKAEAADEVATLGVQAAALEVETAECVPVVAPTLDELLARAPRVHRPVFEVELSETAARIAAFAPNAVDVVRARHGETLRHHGLAFARVRRVLGHEQVWFGVQGAASTTGKADTKVRRIGGAVGRHLLNDETWPELARLLDELATHRRASANDQRHLLYRSAPEAWLESLLRRDITRLDPGLRLAPLHAQFRATRDTTGGGHPRPIDLLALRQDGRLAVIELKIAEDAALPLQGADYWRRISTYHRAGHIERARLFGDAEISDEPPLVYLVAPLLSFHRAFQTLAGCITPEIEMYRFDLNEDWRGGVRVARRLRVN